MEGFTCINGSAAEIYKQHCFSMLYILLSPTVLQSISLHVYSVFSIIFYQAVQCIIPTWFKNYIHVQHWNDCFRLLYGSIYWLNKVNFVNVYDDTVRHNFWLMVHLRFYLAWWLLHVHVYEIISIRKAQLETRGGFRPLSCM